MDFLLWNMDNKNLFAFHGPKLIDESSRKPHPQATDFLYHFRHLVCSMHMECDSELFTRYFHRHSHMLVENYFSAISFHSSTNLLSSFESLAGISTVTVT